MSNSHLFMLRFAHLAGGAFPPALPRRGLRSLPPYPMRAPEQAVSRNLLKYR